MELSQVGPSIVRAAFHDLGDRRVVREVEEISAHVSTNAVYRLRLSDGAEIVAKVSSYGSYVHFRQDHKLVNQWSRLLSGTRYRDFLARVVCKDHRVFTFRDGPAWVAFYDKVPFYDFLPPRLDDGQVEALGREMAHFHLASAGIAHRMNPTWKSVGTDVARLFDGMGLRAYRERRCLSDLQESSIRQQCERFFSEAERLGYHDMARIPILVDWNPGNFSVGMDGDGFKFFSRWDYDWFRLEPRMFDFYFCARVVRDEGDQQTFSYHADPLLEPRFMRFLRAYHQIYPLSESEVLFMKEAYRFFILNYVVRIGHYFFRPSIVKRLRREAVEQYLPAMEALDLQPVWDGLG